MGRKNNKSNKKNKKQGKALTFTLLISASLMTGMVTWVGLNDWDVEKSIEKVRVAIGLPSTTISETVAPVVEPNEQLNPLEGEDRDKSEVPDEVVPDAGGIKEVDEAGKQTVKPDQKPVKPTTPSSKPSGGNNTDAGTLEKPAPLIDKGGYIAGQVLPKEPKYVKNILIANKKYPLPKNYAEGESKEARAAFEKMAAQAKLSQYNLTAFSTYRSFEYQTVLYERYVARDGEAAADTYSARPGYSEHQTGLAFDIGEVNFEQHFASSSFGETGAGKWMAENAHRFGFIMRYPEGKERITGYMHESWHFRYVGSEISTDIYNRKITLEEYLGIQ